MTEEPTAHDEGDLWADKAPRGWVRCPKCGEEWADEDEPACKCREVDLGDLYALRQDIREYEKQKRR